MRAYTQLRFASLLLGMSLPGSAAAADNWRDYKLAVMQTVVEVALPYDRLNELTRTDWQAPYRAPRLERMLIGQSSQVRLFTALLDIKGLFSIGADGRIDFFAIANKKPDWFKGDLFDIDALKAMMEHRVRVLGRGAEFRFEVVTINGVPWVHWWDYDAAVPPSGAWPSRLDRYTRPLTNDLYLDVAIDLLKATTSEDLRWLKTAEPIRERLRNSLVIKYPPGTPSLVK